MHECKWCLSPFHWYCIVERRSPHQLFQRLHPLPSLVFRGPVRWTGKNREPDWTKPRSGFFSGCGCLKSYKKNRFRLSWFPKKKHTRAQTTRLGPPASHKTLCSLCCVLWWCLSRPSFFCYVASYVVVVVIVDRERGDAVTVTVTPTYDVAIFA